MTATSTSCSLPGPTGMRVELNFDAAEAEAHGIKPAMTAAEAVAS